MAWHRMVILAAAVLALAGCNMISGADRLATDLLERARAAVEAAEAEEAAAAASQVEADPAVEAVAPDEPSSGLDPSVGDDPPPAAAESASSIPSLRWCWGGFDGSKAKEVAAAQIGSLKVTSSGMSYKWVKGGCEKLGASSKSDYSQTLACLFIADGRGGKFDWISTSRTSRSLENVFDGYHGWDAEAFKKSQKVFFCIVSKDGKKRTNIIEAAK